MVVAALVLAVISLWLNAQGGGASAAQEELTQLRAQIELSKLKLQRDLDNSGAESEARRSALAGWLADNKTLFDREKELVAQIAAARPALAAEPIPAAVPRPEGLSDEEFLAAARRYIRLVEADLKTMNPIGQVSEEEAMDQRRAAVANWRGQAEIQGLLAQMEEARARLAASQPAPTADRVEATELATLPALERAEAEAYNLILDAYETRPWAEGEEVRDRVEEIVGAALRTKQEEIRSLREARGWAAREARITELESLLTP